MATPQRTELETLLRSARAIAVEAGRQILQVYRSGFDVERKSDLTPVTSADLAAHRLILEGLSQLPYPFPILSEESDSIPFSVRRDWTSYWLVDPLDGTREFINHSGQFTVNIALISDHMPVLGVVHAPALGYGYFAARELGAFKVEDGNEPVAIRTRSLGTRRPVVAASHSHRGEDLRHFLTSIGDHKLVHVGGALKSCLVAEGRADLYVRLGPTSEWDTAAAQCIVEEAGGRFTDTALKELRYNTKESLLNPHFFVFGPKSRDWSRVLSGLHHSR